MDEKERTARGGDWRSRIGGAGIPFAACSAVASLLNAASGLVILRFVEPVAMGWWNASQMLRVPFDVLRGGILSGMNREYPFLVGAGQADEARRVLETGLAYTLLSMVASQLVLAVVLLVVGRETPMLFWGLAGTGVVWGLGAYSQYVRSTLRTSRQFATAGWLMLLVAVVDTALVALVWRFGFAGLVWRAVVSGLVAAAVSLRFQRAGVRPRLSGAVLTRLFRFGRHSYVTGFLLLVGAQAERLMLLGEQGGVELLGLFAPALAASSLLQSVQGSLQGFHYPRLMEAHGRQADQARLRSATLGVVRRVFLVMVPVSAATAVGLALLVDLVFPRYLAGLPAALVVCAAGPCWAFRCGSIYFAALHRWPEYYAYTLIQCALPFALIWSARTVLLPLPAAALGGSAALAVAGAALVLLIVQHSPKSRSS